MEMTWRELQVALTHIGIRSTNEFSRQAALHGVKLPTKSLVPKNDSFTDEEQSAADSHLQKRMAQRVAI